MFESNLEDAFITVSKRFKMMVAVNILLLLVVLILSTTLLRMRVNTVVLPICMNDSFEVTGSTVNDGYLIKLSRYFLSQFLDLSPSNIHDKALEILKDVEGGDSYKEIEQKLLESEKKYKENLLTTSFSLSSLKVDKKKLTAFATGSLASFFGKEGKIVEKIEVDMEYSYEAGVPKIKKFLVNKKGTREEKEAGKSK